jgi:hypothetical protein
MSEYRSVRAPRPTPLILLIVLVAVATAAHAAVGFRVSFRDNASSNLLTRRDPRGLSAFGRRAVIDIQGSREISVAFDSSFTEATYRSRVKDTNLVPPDIMDYQTYSELRMAYDLRRAIREARAKSYKAVSTKAAGEGVAIDLPYRIKSKTFRRLFGGDNVGVRVQGDITINGSIRRQKFDEQQSNMKNSNTAFRIDMVQRFTITGKVGQKVEVKVDQDSERLFDFENSLKLTYTGDEDEIIQKVEAGNVALNLGTRLATFSGKNTGLFGLKTQMKIGALSLTGIASLERGQKNRQSPNKNAERQVFYEKNFLANTYFFVTASSQANMDTAGTDNIRLIPNFRENYRHYKNRQHIAVSIENQISDIEVYVSATNQGPQAGQQIYGRAAAMPFVGDLRKQSFPQDANHAEGNWIRLDKSSAYEISKTLGLIRLRTALAPGQMLACAFARVGGGAVLPDTFGTLQANLDTLSLVLLHSQDPSPEDSTWNLMLRNIYNLQAQSLDPKNFKLTISREGASSSLGEETGPRVEGFCPSEAPSSCSYISYFGFDYEGQGGVPGADGLVDDNQTLIRWDLGELEFLDLTPFDPSGYWNAPDVATAFDSVYFKNWHLRELGVASGDTSVGTTAFLASYLYNTKPSLHGQQGNRWRFSTEYKGSTSVFQLGPLVLEGSEEVTNNGQQLVRNVDYTIDYMSGTLKILNEAAKAPNAALEVTYESGKVFQLDKTTLLGGRAEYGLWDDSYIGGMVLYLDQKTLDRRVRIGNEPIRNTLYDLNTSLKFKPNFLTRGVDALPLVRTEAPSSMSIDAEIAKVFPNPNSLSNARTGDFNGLAYIDDFEGARRATPLGLQRRTWSIASFPLDSRIDSLRGRLRWYNPNTRDQVAVKDVYPNRDVNGQVANTLQSLIMSFAPDTTDPLHRDPRRSWGGMMRYLGEGYSDQSLSQYLEFWIRMPVNAQDSAKLIVDLGTLSEDALPNDSMDTEDIPLTPRTEPRQDVGGNRVLEPEEDTGIDHQFADDPNDRALWNGTGRPPIPSYDDWSHNSGSNDFKQINGTEHNRQDEGGGYPDTEDLNGNRTLDQINSYLSFTIPLNLELARARKYIVGEGKLHKNWYLFRIPLTDNLRVGGGDLTSVKWARLALTGFTRPDSIEMVQMDIVSNEWQVPLTATDTTKRVVAAVINSHENPGYRSPPGVEGDVDPITNLRQREQSLVLKIKNLYDSTGTFFLAKNLYQQYNLLEYKRLKMFVHGGDSLEGRNFREDKYQLVLRLGQNYGSINNNYYDIVVSVKPGWDPTNAIDVAMNDLSDLNRLRRESLERGEITNASGRFAFANKPEIEGDSLIIEGNPTLSSIGFLAMGVRLRPGKHYHRPNTEQNEEIWVDELRVSDIYKEPGTAAEVSTTLQLADLLTVSGGYNQTDANFHNVNTRINSAQASSNSLRGNIALNLQKFYLDRFGFQLPLSLSYSEATTTPRVMPGSDTRISADQAPDSIKTHQKTLQYRIQYSKGGNSKSPIVRWTAEKLQLSYDYSLDKRSDYNILENRNTAEGATASYTLPTSKGRGIAFLGWAKHLPPISWLGQPVFYFKPTKLTVSAQANKRVGYSAARPVVIVHQPDSLHEDPYLTRTQQITNTRQFYTSRTGNIGFSPLQPITIDFTRTYKGLLDSTKDWSSLFRWDFGQTNEINQTLTNNYTPEFTSWFKPTVSYSAGYTWANRNPLQLNGQGISNQRTVGTDVTLDLKSIFGGGGGGDSRSRSRERDRTNNRDRGPTGANGPGRAGEDNKGLDDMPPPPSEDGKPPTPTTPMPPAHDRARTPEPVPQKNDSLHKAPADSMAVKPKGGPLKSLGQLLNPIGKSLLMLDPIAFSYDNTANHAETGTDGQARLGYQLGFTQDPKLPLADLNTLVAPTLRKGEDFTARSGLRLTQNIRTTFNYSHRTSQTASSSTTGSVDQSMFWLGGKGKPTSFPFVDVTLDWTGLEKISFLSKATKTVTLSSALGNKVTENWAGSKSNTTTRSYTRQWNPLLGATVTWQGDIETQARYTSSSTFTDNVSVKGKGRNSENRIALSVGYTIRTGFRVPLFFMRSINLQNQTTFSLAVDYAKQKTEATQPTGNENVERWAPTAATTSWSLQPRMTYSFSQTVTGQASMTLQQQKNDITQNKTQTFEFGIQVNIAIRG